MFKNSRKFYKISSPETLLISQTSGGVLLVVTRLQKKGGCDFQRETLFENKPG